QLCNGIWDCENGAGEERCFELELNECNPDTHYRCHSGQCIIKSFSFDHIYDCMDYSDEQGSDVLDIKSKPCHKLSTIECEEYNCAWLKFSCSDGQCIRNSEDHLCESPREVLYNRQKNFRKSNDDLTELCWKYMMCITGMSTTTTKLSCYSLCPPPGYCTSYISVTVCPYTFVFPQNFVIFPFVHTIYMLNQTLSTSKFLPEFICYDVKLCKAFPPTHYLLGYSCRKRSEFYSLDAITSWRVLFTGTQIIFSSCTQYHLSALNLFHCNNSNKYISKYRVNNGFDDWDLYQDEKYSNTCGLNLKNDQFECFAGEQCFSRVKFLDTIENCDDKSDEPLRFNCLLAPDENNLACELIRNLKKTLPTYFLFQDLCDDLIFRNIPIDNETDETNCDLWPCNSRSKTCNGFWNCPNALTCLPLEKAGDDETNCVGATDERTGYCRSRFRCDSNEKDQGERVTIFLEFVIPSNKFEHLTLFRLMTYLLDENNTILNTEQVVHSPYIQPDQRSLKFVCICQKNYFGVNREHQNAVLTLNPSSLIYQDVAAAIIIHFVKVNLRIGFMEHEDRFLYKNSELNYQSVQMYLNQRTFISTFVYLQIFNNIDSNKYYLIVLLSNKTKIRELNTTIQSHYNCPHVNEIIRNLTLINYSPLKRIKYYHNLCSLNKNLKCFYDEIYQCFCYNNFQPDYLVFNHHVNNCTTDTAVYCQNDARCLQANRQSIYYFTCLYSLEIKGLIQTFVFIVVVVLTISSFIANLISITTFCQPKPREVGCGLYLLTLSIISQLNIFIFGLRFISLLLNQFTFISCILLEFLLSVIPSIFDWLTALIAIERTITVIKEANFNKKKSYELAKYIIICIFIIIPLSSLHKPFHCNLTI
ncbi:unnamed protein product, partial [Didymodactylos carnosus]